MADTEGVEHKGAFVKQAFRRERTIEEIRGNKSKIEVLSKVPPSGRNLYEEFDQYISSKEKKVTPATKTIFKNVKEHLLAFEQHRGASITLRSFDYAFYQDFIDFLRFDYEQPRRREKTCGLKTNTIGKTIRQLRIFIRDRVRRKLIEPIDLTDFKIPEEEADTIYLTHEEIARIYRTDLSQHPHLVEYRDLFVLSCLTGLRFSDISNLRPEDLRNNMLYKKQEKSDHWVVIPMRSEAKRIFKERLSQLTNPEFNRHIKTVGQLAGIEQNVTFRSKRGSTDVIVSKPKHEWITTHTARRSFCTNEFLKGTPVKLIMQISGHKKEVNFYKYIRISPEEAAMKVEKAMAREGRDVRVSLGATPRGGFSNGRRLDEALDVQP